MRKTLTLLIFAFSFSMAMGQSSPPEDEIVEEAIRRYKVEIIVFSYEEDVSVGSEVFLADAPPAVEEPLLDNDEIDAVPADEEIAAPPMWVVDMGTGEEAAADIKNGRDLRVVLLGEDELELGEAIRKFDLLDAYKTIMHIGWIQPTYPEEDTPAIELRLLGEPPQGLDGSFTLYLSRYLHLVVDLALDAPGQFEQENRVDEAPAFRFGDSRTPYADNFGVQPQPVRYRIQENRIVKNGELRYFDHPKFGLLAKVVRVEEEEEQVPIPLIGAGGQ